MQFGTLFTTTTHPYIFRTIDFVKNRILSFAEFSSHCAPLSRSKCIMGNWGNVYLYCPYHFSGNHLNRHSTNSTAQPDCEPNIIGCGVGSFTIHWPTSDKKRSEKQLTAVLNWVADYHNTCPGSIYWWNCSVGCQSTWLGIASRLEIR